MCNLPPSPSSNILLSDRAKVISSFNNFVAHCNSNATSFKYGPLRLVLGEQLQSSLPLRPIHQLTFGYFRACEARKACSEGECGSARKPPRSAQYLVQERNILQGIYKVIKSKEQPR